MHACIGLVASVGSALADVVMLLILVSMYQTRYLLANKELTIKTTRIIGGSKSIPLKTIESVEKTVIPLGVKLFGVASTADTTMFQVWAESFCPCPTSKMDF